MKTIETRTRKIQRKFKTIAVALILSSSPLLIEDATAQTCMTERLLMVEAEVSQAKPKVVCPRRKKPGKFKQVAKASNKLVRRVDQTDHALADRSIRLGGERISHLLPGNGR